MTRVTFYFNANDKAEVAMRLAAKAFAAGQCVLVFEPDPARHAAYAGRFEQYRKLWPLMKDYLTGL